ncbi:uncharacterized protein HKW66_Vig0246080 [Vigna angularis]|uniref:Uncharacterized protein n=1 Tax=Phaseolus angularis TaxID=3914 RepID=A0A8T0KBP7_PHAAN|nr:uncharacterized protein HKW66_Vig0246080 [Vigna angularis]
MFDDLSQLMNGKASEAGLEFLSEIMIEQNIEFKKMREDMDQKFQNRITDANKSKIQRSNQQPTIESHHANMFTDEDTDFTKGIVELVNDEATKSTTLSVDFFSQDEIMRITNDPINHPNAPDDAENKLAPYASHIKFVDVNNENKF